MFRTGALWVLGAMIFVAAHPVGPLQSLGNSAWQVLAPLGMDVAMTPLTADMAFMSANGATYPRRPTLEYSRDGRWQVLPWNEVPFYGMRLPLLLMADQLSHGGVVAGHVRALCYKIHERAPGLRAFRLLVEPPRAGDEQQGFGRTWSCDG